MEGTNNSVVEGEGGVAVEAVEINGSCTDLSGGAAAPALGMAFNTMDELFQFYKKYARATGFGIAKRGRRKDDLTGVERWQTITCTKGGKHKGSGSNILSRMPTQRCGCKARVCCSRIEGVWVISKVELRHNHEVKPTEAKFIPQHRVIEEHIKRQVEANDTSGLRSTNNVNSVVFQVRGHEQRPCLTADIKIPVAKFRRLNLVGRNAQVVVEMFGKMQDETRDFFHFIKLDKEGRLKHAFWADGRCRAAYKEFYDVISFDTTYLVNKYDVPCAVSVGVNHHGKSILLGCALLNNEKCKTFIWLFETWLRCMGGKHPEAIITDQCATIGIAIAVVFPNTRHRWCMRYIVNKFPSKIAKNKNYGLVKEAFMEAIYDSMSESDFEERWGTMVANFQLESNDWISQLYESRHRWVPVFVKSSFWAGMSLIQRSESMNSFFDGYLNSRTPLQKFVEQCPLAVTDKIEKEVQLDFLSNNTQIPCVTRWSFEVQLCRAYTSSIFKMVQKQLVDSMYCELSQISADGGEITYEVTELVIAAGVKRKRVKFIVKYDADKCDVKCNCLLFEFRGVLCSHVFKVLIANDVEVIPDKYILRRWRKDIARCHSMIKVGSSFPSIELSRTKSLEKTFYTAIDIAVSDLEKFTYLEMGLKEWLHHLENWSVNSATMEAENNGAQSSGGGRGSECCERRKLQGLRNPK